MIDSRRERKFIRKTALENGFKLKKQPSGETDLNPYVFDFAEKLLAEKKSEITELKQKLARYENPDYVLVPRRPSVLMLSILDKEIKEANIRNAYTQDRSESIPSVAYKAMIEAVEKEND